MAAPSTGRLGRSLAGLFKNRAYKYHLKQVNLLPVKSMKFAFDPFHDGILSTRELAFHMSRKKLRQTNLNCGMKTDVKSDLSDPWMEVTFIDGSTVTYKTANLTTLEVLKHFNELCVEKLPKQTTQMPQTKQEKKKTKKK